MQHSLIFNHSCTCTLASRVEPYSITLALHNIAHKYTTGRCGISPQWTGATYVDVHCTILGGKRGAFRHGGNDEDRQFDQMVSTILDRAQFPHRDVFVLRLLVIFEALRAVGHSLLL